MKKIVFTLLKLIEIPIIIFGPYWLFNYLDNGATTTNWFWIWLHGVGLVICIAAMVFVAVLCCYGLYKGNQKLAEWITNKIK